MSFQFQVKVIPIFIKVKCAKHTFIIANYDTNKAAMDLIHALGQS